MNQIPKYFKDKVKGLSDPVVFHPGGWGADTPAWLMQAIIMDRVIEDEPMATDAEVTAYLMSAAFTAPLDHDHADIYLHVAQKTMEKYKGAIVPDDLRRDELSDWQQMLLRDLKHKIYTRRRR